LYLSAERWLGDVQLLRSLAEASLSRDRDKIAKLPQLQLILPARLLRP